MTGDDPRADRGRVLLAPAGDPPLELLARALLDGGFEVDREDSLDGVEAAVRKGRPDALVIDPGEPGDRVGALVGRLRASPWARHMPVIVLAPGASVGEAPPAGFDLPLTEYLPREVPLARLVSRARSNVEVKRLIDYGERRSERLAALLEISRALNSTLDSGAILYIIARKLGETIDLVRCSFIVPDLAQGVGRVIACKDDPNIHSLEINLANYPEIIHVFRTGKRVVIADVGSDPIMAGVRKFADVFRDQSIMTLPLEFHGETIGVLQIRKKSHRQGFTPREIEYCELLANAAANALKNAQLYEDIEKHNYELRRQKRELENLSEELGRKHQELLRLQQQKEEFTTMIVHDLRSPLMIVQGVLDLLAHKHRGARDDRELIQDGIGVTKKILALINNLLEVSRIESGELRLKDDEVDVGDLVRETVEPYRVLAASRRIDLVATVGQTLPRLRGDRRCLGQVLDNLLANSFQFTLDGGRIEVRAEPGAGSEEALRLVVEDTGSGIPADDLPYIFQRFRQGKTARRKGTGLGLTIVDLLVQAHGGRVSVETEVGKGSRFIVALPDGTPRGAEARASRELSLG